MTTSSVLVLAATPLESTLLRSANLVVTGIGAVNTAHALSRYLATKPKPSLVIQTGIAGAYVPANVEVEGRLRPHGLDIADLHRRGLELTLRLSDGRALDFSFIDEEGGMRSTGRQLYQP